MEDESTSSVKYTTKDTVINATNIKGSNYYLTVNSNEDSQNLKAKVTYNN
jgi:hypothetical protein